MAEEGRSQTIRSQTRVELPPAVARPFEVYLNGVAQMERIDAILARKPVDA